MMTSRRLLVLVLVLMVGGRTIVRSRGSAIHDAARVGDRAAVAALLDGDRALVHAKDESGRTPLHWAARGVHLDVMALLIERGADVDARDANAVTPLQSVAVRNHPAATALLLGNGARVDGANQVGQTALHLAAQAGAADSVAVLVAHGATVDARDAMGRTPLVLGSRQVDAPKVTSALLDAGADIDSRDNSGSTALDLAAWRGYADVVEVLLDRRATLPSDADGNWTLLSDASKRGLTRLYRALVARPAGAAVVARRPGTVGLLHLAAAGGSADIAADVVARGLDVNATDRNGWAPAHYAARDGRVDVLRLLLQHGANPNRRSVMGQSPLNVADENGRAEIRTLLLAARADESPVRFPALTGRYLGQAAPGTTPRLFAPGIVSATWGLHSAAVFSPDGTEVYWAPMIVKPGAAYSSGGLYVMQQLNGRWTRPQLSPLSGDFDDDVPFFSPDGRRLYFISDRPLPGQAQGGTNIWFVERGPSGWARPQPIDPVVNAQQKHWQFSVDRAGNLYFGSSAAGGRGQDDIYVARFVAGHYLAPENLGDRINTPGGERTPYVAPDGRYLLFSRDSDLFVAFRQSDGAWSDPVGLGPTVNTPANELCPVVTADGRYLFYLGTRDGQSGVYWADARVIDLARPRGGGPALRQPGAPAQPARRSGAASSGGR